MKWLTRLMVTLSLCFWFYIAWSSVEIRARKRWGLVRSHDGRVYTPKDYGGFDAAMVKCLRDGERLPEPDICGPRWR